MNPFISQLMQYIPERTPRTLMGAQFESAEKTSCSQMERFAFIARELNWLTPLRVLTREEQIFLGLRQAHGRPQQDGAMGEDELDMADEPLDMAHEPLDMAGESLDEIEEELEPVAAQPALAPAETAVPA